MINRVVGSVAMEKCKKSQTSFENIEPSIYQDNVITHLIMRIVCGLCGK